MVGPLTCGISPRSGINTAQITMPVVLSNRNGYDGVVQYDQYGAIKIRNHLTICQEISWRFEWEKSPINGGFSIAMFDYRRVRELEVIFIPLFPSCR